MTQLLFPQRSYDSFFSDHLKNKKPKTVQHYRYALSDFRDFCSIQFNLKILNSISKKNPFSYEIMKLTVLASTQFVLLIDS